MNVPDGGDDHHDANGLNGLSVEFSIQPQVPGDVGNNATVDEAVFKMLTLQVTGDVASVSTPGNIDLAWRQDTMPDPVVFADAPTGVYSKLSMRIDGQLLDNSYWINGHVQVNGNTYPFKIYDRYYLNVALYPDTTLEPGNSARIGVQVTIDHAIDAIDWSLIDLDNGTYTLDTTDAYMPTFRQKVVESFALHSLQ